MPVLELDTSPRGQLLMPILIDLMAEATIEWIDRLTS
jgi:hypothetical protein